MSTNRPFDPWEARVQAAAQQFAYPPTPPIVEAMRERLPPQRRQPTRNVLRRRSAALITILLIAGSLAVPPVRAAVQAWLRIGAIEFVRPAPTEPAPLPSVLADLAGETTLEQARTQATFPIKLPTYPEELGTPDQVYLQDLNGQAVICVWLDPRASGKVHLSLHALSSAAWAYKIADEQLVEETTVNGERALWVRGPHLLQFREKNGDVAYGTRRLVKGNVLIWQADALTYRLETDLPLQEAVRVAESLR